MNLTKPLVFAILISLWGLSFTHAEVLRVDFNGYNTEDNPGNGRVDNAQATTSDEGLFGPGNFWNGLEVSAQTPNIIGLYFPGPAPALYYEDGQTVSNISVTLNGFIGADWFDPDVGNHVTRDYILGPASPHATITIGGLVPGQSYNLAGYGNNGHDGLGAIWMANGVGPLNLSMGVANEGILQGIVADSNGRIVIDLAQDDLGIGLSCVNGFELTEGDPVCSENLPQDFNRDCYVDLQDLVFFVQNWLLCYDAANESCENIEDIIAAEEMAKARQWVQDKFASAHSVPPISFVYNGVSSLSLLANWQKTQQSVVLDSQRTRHTVTYLDPATGLEVKCVATEYQDYPAVEWVVYYKNTSGQNTPILEDIKSADFDCPSNAAGNFTLHYADGSTAIATDFQPKQITMTTESSRSFTPFGGRPSDGVLPFFNLEKPDQTGTMLAIGWTGQWAASFHKYSAASLNFRAGLELAHFRLFPGEQIRMPSVMLLFWGGDRQRGHNQFRRFLLAHYSPQPGGSPSEPFVGASVHGMYGFDLTPNPTTESNMIEFINNTANHNYPVDYIWIDAGWYDLNGSTSWTSVGTWEPDPARYPNGMDPVADAAHNAGYKFLLWFEPERVMPGSWLYTNHPEWLLTPSNMPGEVAYQQNGNWRLLNLGNPAALAWAKAKFSGMIGDIGIDAYRNDFNMHPVYYWRTGEAADRQGLNEIRYVMGLYDYFDTLQADHPNLIIDNCASGGRRIDFEMLRRALVFTRTDHLWYSESAQSMQYALSFWVPLIGLGTVSLDPYHFRSGMGNSFVTALNHNDPGIWAPATEMLNQYRSISDLYRSDFYPLTEYSIADNTWIAWQYYDPARGRGLVQAFRRPQSTTGAMPLKLKGLEWNAVYTLTNLDTAAVTTETGASLMNPGLPVTISSQPGSAIIVYQKN
ncbi:MAG: Alpha-galactosidase [Planctomycetes bacterium ADurb.Bin412]|nr:MAG: Alpha-galactosidase [Planctomycetes bacterium ADurb.Bin412]